MKIRILASASRDLIDGYRFYEMQEEAELGKNGSEVVGHGVQDKGK